MGYLRIEVLVFEVYLVVGTNFFTPGTNIPRTLVIRKIEYFQYFSRCRTAPRYGFLFSKSHGVVRCGFYFYRVIWCGAVLCGATRVGFHISKVIQHGAVQILFLTMRCGADIIFKNHTVRCSAGVYLKVVPTVRLSVNCSFCKNDVPHV